MDLLKRVIINHAIEGWCAASKNKFGFISQCKEIINFNRGGNVSGHKEPILHCTETNCVHTHLKFTKYTNTEHYGHNSLSPQEGHCVPGMQSKRELFK